MHEKKNILSFVILLCWKTGMWLSTGTVSHPASSHTPSADRLYRSKRHWQPWCWRTKSCWVIKCVGCLKQFLCEKEPLVTEHVYPIKIGWVTRQESPPSTKGSQLDSWLERETLAGESEKLTGSHSENNNTALKKKKGQGNVPWYLDMLCGGGGPRNLRCQRDVWRLVHQRTVNEQAVTTQGWGRTKKATDSSWKWLCFQVISQGEECHQVFWEKWEEIFSTWRSVRNRILNSTERSSSTERWLKQRGKLPLSNPGIPKMTKKDHCSKIRAAFLGVTVLA